MNTVRFWISPIFFLVILALPSADSLFAQTVRDNRTQPAQPIVRDQRARGSVETIVLRRGDLLILSNGDYLKLLDDGRLAAIEMNGVIKQTLTNATITRDEAGAVFVTARNVGRFLVGTFERQLTTGNDGNAVPQGRANSESDPVVRDQREGSDVQNEVVPARRGTPPEN